MSKELRCSKELALQAVKPGFDSLLGNKATSNVNVMLGLTIKE